MREKFDSFEFEQGEPYAKFALSETDGRQQEADNKVDQKQAEQFFAMDKISEGTTEAESPKEEKMKDVAETEANDTSEDAGEKTAEDNSKKAGEKQDVFSFEENEAYAKFVISEDATEAESSKGEKMSDVAETEADDTSEDASEKTAEDNSKKAGEKQDVFSFEENEAYAKFAISDGTTESESIKGEKISDLNETEGTAEGESPTDGNVTVACESEGKETSDDGNNTKEGNDEEHKYNEKIDNQQPENLEEIDLEKLGPSSESYYGEKIHQKEDVFYFDDEAYAKFEFPKNGDQTEILDDYGTSERYEDPETIEDRAKAAEYGMTLDEYQERMANYDAGRGMPHKNHDPNLLNKEVVPSDVINDGNKVNFSEDGNYSLNTNIENIKESSNSETEKAKENWVSQKEQLNYISGALYENGYLKEASENHDTFSFEENEPYAKFAISEGITEAESINGGKMSAVAETEGNDASDGGDNSIEGNNEEHKYNEKTDNQQPEDLKEIDLDNLGPSREKYFDTPSENINVFKANEGYENPEMMAEGAKTDESNKSGALEGKTLEDMYKHSEAESEKGEGIVQENDISKAMEKSTYSENNFGNVASALSNLDKTNEIEGISNEFKKTYVENVKGLYDELGKGTEVFSSENDSQKNLTLKDFYRYKNSENCKMPETISLYEKDILFLGKGTEMKPSKFFGVFEEEGMSTEIQHTVWNVVMSIYQKKDVSNDDLKEVERLSSHFRTVGEYKGEDLKEQVHYFYCDKVASVLEKLVDPRELAFYSSEQDQCFAGRTYVEKLPNTMQDAKGNILEIGAEDTGKISMLKADLTEKKITEHLDVTVKTGIGNIENSKPIWEWYNYVQDSNTGQVTKERGIHIRLKLPEANVGKVDVKMGVQNLLPDHLYIKKSFSGWDLPKPEILKCFGGIEVKIAPSALMIDIAGLEVGIQKQGKKFVDLILSNEKVEGIKDV